MRLFVVRRCGKRDLSLSHLRLTISFFITPQSHIRRLCTKSVLITVAILMLRFSGNGRSRGSALQFGGFHFGLAHFVVFFPLGVVFGMEGER